MYSTYRGPVIPKDRLHMPFMDMHMNAPTISQYGTKSNSQHCSPDQTPHPVGLGTLYSAVLFSGFFLVSLSVGQNSLLDNPLSSSTPLALNESTNVAHIEEPTTPKDRPNNVGFLLYMYINFPSIRRCGTGPSLQQKTRQNSSIFLFIIQVFKKVIGSKCNAMSFQPSYSAHQHMEYFIWPSQLWMISNH